MHKRQLNHARLGLVLRPRGPVLIKSGIETPDPTRPGMEFVRTRHAVHGDTIYLPGTSLKGAIRSHAERVLRGLKVRACDPLTQGERCRQPQQSSQNGELASDRIFSAQCATCRTFGSLALSGRAHVLDAYPWPPQANELDQRQACAAANETDTRWQVGIDRKTGQAQGGALFDLEVAVKGAFYAEVQLRNFQLWQLGLVAAVLREMDEGQVPIGFGKSRGLGQVAVELERLVLQTTSAEEKRLLGVAELCTPDERRAYDLHADDAVGLPEGVRPQRSWRGSRVEASGEDLENLLGAVVDGPLSSFVADWSGRPSVRSRR
jgi:CRISPR-associated RAMP protein (TIGR02581 family)